MHLFGNPGVGKTHVMAAIGHELVRTGHAALFTSSPSSWRSCSRRSEICACRELQRLDRFECLALEDIGYVQQDRSEMEVLFTLLAECYERRSVMITSNLVFSKQGGPTPGRQRDVGVTGAERYSVVVPTIVFHGDRDTKVHPRNGDQVIAQWTTIHARDGAHNKAGMAPQVTLQRGQVPDGHAYTRAIYHDASGQTILEQWSVHGAGHA